MKNKTCNGGYCNYKTFGASTYGCSYDGYCDYQCPKDSRYTSSETDDVLPARVKLKSNPNYLNWLTIEKTTIDLKPLWTVSYRCAETGKDFLFFQSRTEESAKAEMLAYLKENGLMEE